jgi:hypothetical protein
MYQERVSNRLSSQSQIRADRVLELNLKTNQISQEIHELNRSSTEAAKETSQGTRVNVLVSDMASRSYDDWRLLT